MNKLKLDLGKCQQCGKPLTPRDITDGAETVNIKGKVTGRVCAKCLESWKQ